MPGKGTLSVLCNGAAPDREQEICPSLEYQFHSFQYGVAKIFRQPGLLQQFQYVGRTGFQGFLFLNVYLGKYGFYITGCLVGLQEIKEGMRSNYEEIRDRQTEFVFKQVQVLSLAPQKIFISASHPG